MFALSIVCMTMLQPHCVCVLDSRLTCDCLLFALKLSLSAASVAGCTSDFDRWTMNDAQPSQCTPKMKNVWMGLWIMPMAFPCIFSTYTQTRKKNTEKETTASGTVKYEKKCNASSRQFYILCIWLWLQWKLFSFIFGISTSMKVNNQTTKQNFHRTNAATNKFDDAIFSSLMHRPNGRERERES